MGRKEGRWEIMLERIFEITHICLSVVGDGDVSSRDV